LQELGYGRCLLSFHCWLQKILLLFQLSLPFYEQSTPSFKIQKLKFLKLATAFNVSLIATPYEGAAVPPTNFNAPDDGRVGRNMQCSEILKTITRF
jgi:hypothetical protein